MAGLSGGGMYTGIAPSAVWLVAAADVGIRRELMSLSLHARGHRIHGIKLTGQVRAARPCAIHCASCSPLDPADRERVMMCELMLSRVSRKRAVVILIIINESPVKDESPAPRAVLFSHLGRGSVGVVRRDRPARCVSVVMCVSRSVFVYLMV